MKTKMYSLICVAILIFSSCGNDQTADIAKVKRERDSVIQLAIVSDSTITGFINYMAEIENGLMNIKRKENNLTVKQSGDLNGTVKDNINNEIKEINELMDQNRKSIEELNSKLKKSQFKVGKLNRIIAVLNEQLLEKNADLERLNADLLAKSATIDQLNTSMTTLIMRGDEKSDTIQKQHTKLNEVYYIVGNYKDLRDKNVLDKKGGFLGLGKEKMLKEDFNTESFTRVDLEKTTSLPVAGKKVKLITSHPANSYKLERDEKKAVTGMVITDPQSFWKASKYLVVLID